MLGPFINPHESKGNYRGHSIFAENRACKHFDMLYRYLCTYLQNETPHKEAPEKDNNQPHLVMINHDDYDQHFIAIERKLYMESTDLATALFHLVGCHYIFNLDYHQKLTDLMLFLQEKVVQIPSAAMTKWKSAVSITHVNGISSHYKALKMTEEPKMYDSDDD